MAKVFPKIDIQKESDMAILYVHFHANLGKPTRQEGWSDTSNFKSQLMYEASWISCSVEDLSG